MSYTAVGYPTTGHERDDETGFDYRGARFYDGEIGRFLSIDPLQAMYPSWSAYNYVMGNPVIFIDPTGKSVETTDPREVQAKKDEEAERQFNEWNTNDLGANGIAVVGRPEDIILTQNLRLMVIRRRNNLIIKRKVLRKQVLVRFFRLYIIWVHHYI